LPSRSKWKNSQPRKLQRLERLADRLLTKVKYQSRTTPSIDRLREVKVGLHNLGHVNEAVNAYLKQHNDQGVVPSTYLSVPSN
jgi:hypothetical protein